MALRLARNSLIDCRMQEIVGFARAKRRPQIGRVLLAEVHIESARAGDAHAIASVTEIVAERREKPIRPPVSPTLT